MVNAFDVAEHDLQLCKNVQVLRLRRGQTLKFEGKGLRSISQRRSTLERLLTLIYAMTAAKSYRAEVVLIPVLDIVQSVPILE